MSEQNTIRYHIGMAVTDIIAEPLVEWFKTNKNVDVTKEEIASALGIVWQSRPQPTMVRNPVTSIPNYAGAPVPIAPLKQQTKRPRRKQPEDTKPKCEYEYQRGNNQGKKCGRAVAGEGTPGGDKYCKLCLKKGKVKEELTKGTFNKDIVAKPKIKGNVHVISNENQTDRQLDVLTYKFRSGYYYHTDTKFVLQTLNDNTGVVIGVDDNNDGNIRPLSKEEEDTALKLYLSIAEIATTTDSNNHKSDDDNEPFDTNTDLDKEMDKDLDSEIPLI